MILYYLIGIGILFYFGIVAVTYSIDREYNHKYHGGMYFGWWSYDTRKGTTKDVWFAMIWPLRLVWYIIAVFAILIHGDVIPFFCLMVGFKYDETKTYRTVQSFLQRFD